MVGLSPVGRARYRGLRFRFQKLLFGPGLFPEFIAHDMFIAPTVSHDAYSYKNPDAETVSVGWGTCASSLSPWPCPFLPAAYSADKARQFFRCRADFELWQVRLCGKSLLCNCRCDPRGCWANLLQNEFGIVFLDFITGWSTFTYDVDDEGLDVQPEISMESHARGRDEIGSGSIASSTSTSSSRLDAWKPRLKGDSSFDDRNCAPTIPTAVPWPDAWFELVKTVRGLEHLPFWEIFAGMAALTQAFRTIGIRCVPPLDVIYSPEFNVLNPQFLAVVVGILASHLVDLAHVAPPCASFSAILNACAS